MDKLRMFWLAAAALVLAACGGGGDNSIVGNSGGAAATVGTLTLLTSSPQIPSDGTAAATITALVRDVNNNVMANVGVTFQANSGALTLPTSAKTDQNGVLAATLNTAGDPTNRPITVSAQAGNSAANVTVNVIGTALVITGPTSLPLGATGPYSVTLTNAGGMGIGGRLITVSSSKSNGLSGTQLTTDAQGHASFTLSATNGGNDTLTTTALGITATQAVAVSADVFKFTTPAAATEVTLGSNVIVTVQWQQSGAGVAGQAINFSTTRGTLSAATAVTDGTGSASVTVAANNAGPAVLTATNPSGTSVQLQIEFIATTPASLDLQAEPFTLAAGGQSTITATVRDAAGNLVKNKIINFVLTDTTGGSLSVAQATTNSQGRAQTFYNASSSTSPVDGVRIDATVQGLPAVTDFAALTVAQRQVFISMGTGNEIFEENPVQYRDPWVIQVTDAQGNGVDLVNLTVSVLSERYWDGVRFPTTTGWRTQIGVDALPAAGCPDEDINRNGVLDAGEDLNTNHRIEAGNVATVAAHTVGGSTVTTDSNGFALVDVFYPQAYAYWLEVTLEVRASVQGTEFSKRSTFMLPGTADDFNDPKKAPPGPESPFGTDGICGTPPPPDGP